MDKKSLRHWISVTGAQNVKSSKKRSLRKMVVDKSWGGCTKWPKGGTKLSPADGRPRPMLCRWHYQIRANRRFITFLREETGVSLGNTNIFVMFRDNLINRFINHILNFSMLQLSLKCFKIIFLEYYHIIISPSVQKVTGKVNTPE